eukprot:275605-Pelagomonas_calceolata.AAC.2
MGALGRGALLLPPSYKPESVHARGSTLGMQDSGLYDPRIKPVKPHPPFCAHQYSTSSTQARMHSGVCGLHAPEGGSGANQANSDQRQLGQSVRMEAMGEPLPAMSPAAKGILVAAGMTGFYHNPHDRVSAPNPCCRIKQQTQQRSQPQQRQQVVAAHAEPLERGMNLKELIKANKEAERSRKA